MASHDALTTPSCWYVYVVRCADGSLYTGIATDLVRRVRQHNGELAGGPKYTRGRRPVVLEWSCSETSRGEALRREAAIKRLSKTEKQQLISRQ